MSKQRSADCGSLRSGAEAPDVLATKKGPTLDTRRSPPRARQARSAHGASTPEPDDRRTLPDRQDPRQFRLDQSRSALITTTSSHSVDPTSREPLPRRPRHYRRSLPVGLGRRRRAGHRSATSPLSISSSTSTAVADNTVGKAIGPCAATTSSSSRSASHPSHCQLLFRLVAAAYERRSIAIGSHSPFDQWGRFLPDQPTAVSLLDRLCHHAHIITTTGDSYRLTHRTTHKDP